LAVHSLTNTTIKKPGRVVTLPVAVLIGSEPFTTEEQLNYSTTADKSGMAK